jgi:serine/threonine protein kinase
MADLPGEPRHGSEDWARADAAWPRIVRYKIEARVGAGGMAVVFRAHDERLRRLVALKVLAPAVAADERFRRRFIRESRAAAMVDDPHIIPIFDAGESGGLLYIAMRFVAGGDVRSLLSRSGPMSAQRAAGIVSATASALDAAHRAGLVHRDVKPANMLIDLRPGRPDHVYLSDFGLSKGALSSGGVTRAGHVVGTPAYMAPEQAAGRTVDGRADQYALACVAYELLTGKPPFVRDDATATIYAHIWEPPPAATALRRWVPAAVDSVLAKAMSKDPQQRFLTCQEFAESLRSGLELQPYSADPGTAATDRQSIGSAGKSAASSSSSEPRVMGGGNGAVAVRPRLDSAVALPGEIEQESPNAPPDEFEQEPPSASLAGPSRELSSARLAELALESPGTRFAEPAAPGPPSGSDRRPAKSTRRAVITRWAAAIALAALIPSIVVVALRKSSTPERLSPFRPVSGHLMSVSVIQDGSALAVGYRCATTCGTQTEIDKPLIIRWNGSTWSQMVAPVTTGSARLDGVAAAPNGLGYAVGYTCLAKCGTTSEVDRPLIFRSNGSAWSPITAPAGTGSARLTGVAVASKGRAYAVGYTCLENCGLVSEIDRPLILRMSDSGWSRVNSPSLPRSASLAAVSADAGGNAWAVGTTCARHCKSLIMRSDGSAWFRVPGPSPRQNAYLTGVATTPTGGAFASGWYYCSLQCGPPHGTVSRTLILRWDGRSWSQVKTPNLAANFNILYGITTGPGGTAWAVGIPVCGQRHCPAPADVSPFILHGNGTAWSRATMSPHGDFWLRGVSAGPGSDVWAVGDCAAKCGRGFKVDRTLILHWTGSSWSEVR